MKLTFSLIVTFYLTKTENRTKKSLILLLWVKILFLPKKKKKKKGDFLQKMLTWAKLKGPWYEKVYFMKLNMCVITCQIWSF